MVFIFKILIIILKIWLLNFNKNNSLSKKDVVVVKDVIWVKLNNF